MLTITEVDKDSFGKELGLECGDRIVAFASCEARDILDYCYYDSFESFKLKVLTRQGKSIEIDVDKGEETLGLAFSEELTPKSCKNKCIFCFIEQLPKDMRSSLYIKDDDYRTSFVCGSYVTLTNTSDEDIARIIEQKLSPLYVSVHAYTDSIRRKLITNPNTDKLFEKLRKLSDNGIKMHTQIVLIPEYNDGNELSKTIDECYKLKGILSIAVVPVGLTKYRNNSLKLNLVDKITASEAIDICQDFKGKRDDKIFAICSDEIYIIAERKLPDYNYYGDFEQIENGVGLIAEFEEGMEYALQSAPILKGNYGIVTGVSASKFITSIADKLMALYKELNIEVFVIINNFFGQSITVAGLITGADIIEQLRGKSLPNELLIPNVMLKEFEDVFLDGKTPFDIENELKIKVSVVKTNGEALINKMEI